MVSSGLALCDGGDPTYSATKAAIHSYSISLRHQLRGAEIEVIEIAPPYVQTHLMGEHQANDPNAMPLGEFIAKVMQLLSSQPDIAEVVAGRWFHYGLGENGKLDAMFQAVDSMGIRVAPGRWDDPRRKARWPVTKGRRPLLERRRSCPWRR